MLTNIYSNKSSGLVVTEISGGREHFTARNLSKPVATYSYEMQYGENWYLLAAKIFADDAMWWALADLNPVKDVFSFSVGDTVLLPKNIVSITKNKKGIF